MIYVTIPFIVLCIGISVYAVVQTLRIKDKVFHIQKGLVNTPLPLWHRILREPVVLSMLGVLFMAAISTYLVSNYSTNQKLKLDRTARLLEQVSNYEAAVENISREVNVVDFSGEEGVLLLPPSNDVKVKFDTTERIKTDILSSLNENRFLVGDDVYNLIRNYVNSTYDYYFSVQSGKATDDMKKKRTEEMKSIFELPKRV